MKPTLTLLTALLLAPLAAIPAAFADELPHVDAAGFGFSPTATPSENVAALQKALDGGHKVVTISTPGIYDLDATVYVDSHTRLACGKDVTLRKAAPYGFILINRGVRTREWNERIAIDGLHIACNGHSRMPPPDDPAFGMRGHVSMFRVKGIEVTNFRCIDVKEPQFCLQFNTFEDLLVDGFEIRGGKDGVHLGRGKRFVIRNGVCQTGDDAIALNAEDYPNCSPAQGDIADGLVENIVDEPIVPPAPQHGNLSRLITGAWVDWHEGIRLQNGDTVRHGRHVYRILATFDTTQHESKTPPTHTSGAWRSPEGLTFVHNTSDSIDRASIRNVTFRNIRSLARNGFSAAWESDKYHRAVHPEVKPDALPVCEVNFENCTSASPKGSNFLSGNSNLKATLRNVAGNARLVAVTGNVHPIAVDLMIENSPFRPSDKPDSLPDVSLGGKVTGRVVVRGNTEVRPIRLAVPESVKVIQEQSQPNKGGPR